MRNVIRSIALMAGLVPISLAADAPDAVPPLTYTHVYADGAGMSHFRDESFDFRSNRPGGPLSHALATGPGAMLLRLKPGAVEDWHNAPRPWYLIVVQGMSEVTTSDGEKRRFGPGSIVLLDDTSGKGHQTRTVGTVDHIAAVVPIADAPTATLLDSEIFRRAVDRNGPTLNRRRSTVLRHECISPHLFND